MQLILGLLSAVVGIVYLWMALKDGFASDRSGRVLARRRTQPIAYWSHLILFALLTVMGIVLVVISTQE